MLPDEISKWAAGLTVAGFSVAAGVAWVRKNFSETGGKVDVVETLRTELAEQTKRHDATVKRLETEIEELREERKELNKQIDEMQKQINILLRGSQR